MSQEGLAQVKSLLCALISNMERGKVNFKLENLMVLAEGLKIDYRELLRLSITL